MSQYSACRNLNPATRARVPLLLDVQSGLLSELQTRVVVPMCPAAVFRDKTLTRLMPVLEVEGKKYVCVVPELAGVSHKLVGPAVADFSAQSAVILGAIDLLLTGI